MLDRRRAAELGAAGQVVARRDFTAERMAEATRSLYRQILTGR